MLKNPEIRRTLCFFLPIGAAGAAAAWYFDTRAGIAATAALLALLTVWLVETYRRYRAMARLATELDEVLHGKPGFVLSEYTEGEVSLLRSQLQKLTICLREQAAQLEAEKTQLAEAMADISHQIRTPLTAVNLLLAELSSPENGENARAAAVFALRQQAARIDWLVNSLLKLAKLDAGTVQLRPQALALSDLIARAAEPLAVLMDVKGQALEVSASGSVVCDPQWTAEALGNILKNCTEHMESGRITVTAEENAVASCITIRDEGGGIDPEDLPHLFERYYKGKNASAQSVGIGLALSRSIVAAQNGTLRAANRPGGAEFTIKFYKTAV